MSTQREMTLIRKEENSPARADCLHFGRNGDHSAQSLAFMPHFWYSERASD